MELLIIRIGPRLVGIPSRDVEQILHMAEITPLSHPDPAVVGVLNLHGDVLLVSDPRPRLGLPTPAARLDQRLILISGQPRFFFWVDAVEGLTAPDDSLLELAPDERDSVSSAVATVDGRPVPVLNLSTFVPAGLPAAIGTR